MPASDPHERQVQLRHAAAIRWRREYERRAVESAERYALLAVKHAAVEAETAAELARIKAGQS